MAMGACTPHVGALHPAAEGVIEIEADSIASLLVSEGMSRIVVSRCHGNALYLTHDLPKMF